MAKGGAFDELWGESGKKAARPGFEPIGQLAHGAAARRAGAPPAGRRGGVPPARHHLRRLWRGGGGRADHPVRHRPAHLLRAPNGRGSRPGSNSGCGRSTLFIDDVYGARKILADEIVPGRYRPRQQPVLRPRSPARAPPHGVYAHICGIDLVRTGPDEFFVLEDNARTPSGVSYMLENREAMLRLCPELFDIFAGARRSIPIPNCCARRCNRSRPGCAATPCCVLLTPGHFNSAFYEHSFLADHMGIELVEGRDLEVDDDIVWMRTIDGRVRVDVIYRRIDDDFLDPLVFRPNSLLGVPGLMAAYLAGNVTLVNAPGTGIADDKAIYSYMPEIVRYYTGEEAKLPNVETWRCREPEALQYTLDNLDKLVVKLVDGSGGYGMLVGPTAIEDARSRISAPR